MKKIAIPELVLPAGDLHRAKIAFKFGADAVYLGLNSYSLRKTEIRYTFAEIKKTIELAHGLSKKVYVTFNIFAHEGQLSAIKTDLKKVGLLEPDAFIISDPGIINLAKTVAPKIPIHLSTQANTLNSEALKFWHKQGIKRIVLGRETTLSEIKEIKKAAPKMEIEVFVHGAMCISYSGRCLISAELTGRSANLGACAQPCRWAYDVYLEERSRPGQLMKIEESKEGTYLMSSKDLCLVEHLDKLAEAGVSALKIEGRNKTDYYVATVASAYRRGLDLLKKDKFTAKTKRGLKTEMEALTRRGYTTGFLLGGAKKGETFAGRAPIYGKKYLGFVSAQHKGNWSTIVVKNKLEIDKEYELLSTVGVKKFKIERMKDGSKSITEISPGQKDKKVIALTSIPLPCDSFVRAL